MLPVLPQPGASVTCLGLLAVQVAQVDLLVPREVQLVVLAALEGSALFSVCSAAVVVLVVLEDSVLFSVFSAAVAVRVALEDSALFLVFSAVSAAVLRRRRRRGWWIWQRLGIKFLTRIYFAAC